MTPRRFVLVGHPVAHSISPAIHAAAYRSLGLGHRYETIDAPDEEAVAAVVADLRSGAVSGVNVTVPWKRVALALADRRAETAAEAGAANVLVRDDAAIVAHNTDVAALVDELARSGGRRAACVLGRGGAARAAVVACRALGFGRVVVTTRSWRAGAGWRGSDDFERLGAEPVAWPGGDVGAAWREVARTCDVVVQATSAGMTGADPGDEVAAAVPFQDLPAGALAYDVVYTPPLTPFLRDASAAGVPARGGLGMLVAQASKAIELWLGAAPDRAAMLRAARSALGEGC